MTRPDIETSALRAMETLIKYNVATAPITPLPILKAQRGVFVVSFTEMADETGLDRNNLVTMFGAENQDAVTFADEIGGMMRYFVAYNQRLPFYMMQRALARELGHIILGHDSTVPETVRMTEALYFSRYLLCPRPLIRAIIDSGVPLTVEVVGNITGCYGRSLAGISKTEGAHIPAEMNRKVREQFVDYLDNFISFQKYLSQDDDSPMADFGTYMDNYEE